MVDEAYSRCSSSATGTKTILVGPCRVTRAYGAIAASSGVLSLCPVFAVQVER